MIKDAIIIMPAFNEGAVIQETLDEVKKFASKMIVINDGSVDDTAQKAKAAGAIVLSHSANLGYGAALKTGFTFALRYRTEPFIITFDADGQHDPAYLEGLVSPLRRGEAEYVIGSRFLSGESSTRPRPAKSGASYSALPPAS